MFNFFNKFYYSKKKFKTKSGRIKELNQYKVALVDEVKKLKKEKRTLTRKINENKKNLEMSEDLTDSINELEDNKLKLQCEISKLLNAKEIILSIKELNNKEKLIKSNVELLTETENNLKKSIKTLKEEKALILNDIDTLSTQKNTMPSIDKSYIYSIEYVDTIKDGLEFEKYFSEILDKLGFYEIKITNGSGDFGIDVLAYNDDILYGFQCKLYSSPVGNKAIQEAYSGKIHYNCNVAVVVTNNYFTDNAKEQANDTNVLLWDRNKLISKLNECKKYDFTIKM